jgi:3-hydroxyacyl-[acyl-carrier-protein] dehydratase
MDCRGTLTALTADSASTVLGIDPAAPVFQGHYPDFPIFPGVYLIETALQTIERFAQAKGVAAIRLATLKSARLLAPVRPGDVLTCEARLCDAAWSAEASSWEVECRVGAVTADKLRMTVSAR